MRLRQLAAGAILATPFLSADTFTPPEPPTYIPGTELRFVTMAESDAQREQAAIRGIALVVALLALSSSLNEEQPH